VRPQPIAKQAGRPAETSLPHSITEAIEAIARGEIVVVTDDDDRENEGDLIVAASLCTPEKMAFIIRHCCGIVCAPITMEDARRLHLAPMVAANDAPLGTAFTVSVDVRHGLTTGISAEQRCNTVRALANGNMGAQDFVRPGHVFPLIAKDGGVLMRSGHTEAAVDLCRLAGLAPVGVICELANDDGTVMTGAQIADFAQEHGLKLVSVADLIAFRQAREKLVERVATFPVETFAGELTGHAYVTPFDAVQHFAFVLGGIGDGREVPARLHRADILNDVFAGGDTIKKTLARFAREGRGVLVYLRDGTAGVPANIVGRERETTEDLRNRHWLDVGLGAQILKDLGVSSIRLRTSSQKPRAFVGLSGFGIEIASVEPVE
jgi:3,4-dihydroxy 2-butanone 4-phosphate synthase/GTP cyclohydrolase II